MEKNPVTQESRLVILMEYKEGKDGLNLVTQRGVLSANEPEPRYFIFWRLKLACKVRGLRTETLNLKTSFSN